MNPSQISEQCFYAGPLPGDWKLLSMVVTAGIGAWGQEAWVVTERLGLLGRPAFTKPSAPGSLGSNARNGCTLAMGARSLYPPTSYRIPHHSFYLLLPIILFTASMLK